MKSQTRKYFYLLIPCVASLLAGCTASETPKYTYYSVSGTVSGLPAGGTVYLSTSRTNSANVLVGAPNGSVTLATGIPAGGTYSVQFDYNGHKPVPVGYTCTITNGSGSATANVTNVAVTCAAIPALAGTVTSFAGTAGTAGSSNVAPVSFNSPMGIATDASDNLYVADFGNHIIRKITSAGVVSTLAGTAAPLTVGSFADATGAAAGFSAPQGLAADAAGNLYVADTNNNVIRKIVIATGVVTTLAGSPPAMLPMGGSADGTTGATSSFVGPVGIATDGTNLYVSDSGNNTIRKIVIATGATTTLAGTASLFGGSTDGTGAAALFNMPTALALDGAGNLYVSDSGNNTIRKIVIATKAVTTLVGTAGAVGSTDGTGAAASFSSPQGLAVDALGNLYVSDSLNHTIRKVVIATGVVTTLAGTAGITGSTNGTGTAARFNSPQGLAMDSAGNMFVADSLNHVIRKIQ